MKSSLAVFVTSFLLLLSHFVSAQNNDELDNYIKRLRDDHAGPLKETGFLSAGSDFLYGQDYFEAKNYSSAAGYFSDVVRKQKENAFANYQLAVSLLKQNDAGKAKQAQEYLDNAFRLNPSLKERYKKDMPAASDAPDKQNPGSNNTLPGNNTTTGLEAYIEKLKLSRTRGSAETAMGTAGREALYATEYYEANEYRSAETSFQLSLAKDANNPYVNYMLAVSLAAQGKTTEAKPYLQKAVDKDPLLARRYIKDIAAATIKWKIIEDSGKVKPATQPKTTYGGKLIFGNYTCHQSVWNGPGKSPAYSFQYKGYFALKADGTYRWLDNGETGRYKFDAETGTVTWLSGYFKTSAAKSTQYQSNKETVQMTVNFTDSYRWECGCKK